MSVIALVGLPGSGKSTVGRHLARSLHLPFVDSDAEIERRIGDSIRAFFEREGEESFRDLEQATLGELSAVPHRVLATGGGSVLREANRTLLKGRSTVVYLRARPEDLARRLRNDTKRPLLQVANPLKRLRDLYAIRDPLYRETAHYVVDIGRPSLPTLVNTILMQLELAGIVDAVTVPSPVDAGSLVRRSAPPDRAR